MHKPKGGGGRCRAAASLSSPRSAVKRLISQKIEASKGEERRGGSGGKKEKNGATTSPIYLYLSGFSFEVSRVVSYTLSPGMFNMFSRKARNSFSLCREIGPSREECAEKTSKARKWHRGIGVEGGMLGGYMAFPPARRCVKNVSRNRVLPISLSLSGID